MLGMNGNYIDTGLNQSEINYNASKKYADNYSGAMEIANNEKDSSKRNKMISRIALGIFDFSDI